MDAYFECLLEKELIPAMGCTEPIAIAYAGAKARQVLNQVPDRITVKCSGNIIKNVKGVVVPSTPNMRGIEASAILGVLAGNADKKLEVLEDIDKSCIDKMIALKNAGYCKVELAKDVDTLYIDLLAFAGDDSSEVVISNSHTNIVKLLKNESVIFEKEVEDEKRADMKNLSLGSIYDYAKHGNIDRLKPLLDLQMKYNVGIAEEGLSKPYGANVGKTVLKQDSRDISVIARAFASAGSDARMAGCELPVVINSGSGNQGITVSVPVVAYAEHLSVSREKLYRALILSNLVAIYIKMGIGKLSAYCGVVGAACGAGAGIGFLHDDSFAVISKTISNTLGNVSGIICDGAKASCAAKIASSLDAAIMARNLAVEGNVFQDGEGIVKADAEDTIKNIWKLGKDGMKETDIEILNMMLSN